MIPCVMTADYELAIVQAAPHRVLFPVDYVADAPVVGICRSRESCGTTEMKALRLINTASERGGNSEASSDCDCDHVSRRNGYLVTGYSLPRETSMLKRCPYKRRGCEHRIRSVRGFYDMWKDLRIYATSPDLCDARICAPQAMSSSLSPGR